MTQEEYEAREPDELAPFGPVPFLLTVGGLYFLAGLFIVCAFIGAC